jgi:lysophospholipase L1-like esterase
MKKIVCFGDSNTFGFNPIDGSRYLSNERWAGILKERLKENYNVVEQGCNNRTCFIDNPNGIEQTGYKVLKKYVDKNTDYLILAIGINDLQKYFAPSINEIENGIKNLIFIAKEVNPNINIILASPSVLKKCILEGFFAFQFDEKSILSSYEMSKIYEKVAKENNCIFIDLNEVTDVSDIDGLHYTIEGHKKIAEKFYNLFNTLKS